MRQVRRFLNDQTGGTAIEYALVASLIGAILVGVLMTIGTSLKTSYSNAANGFK